MRSCRSPSRMADAEHSDEAAPAVDSDLPASIAEAEAAVSRAELRAEEARAHAARLRQQAEGGEASDDDGQAAADEAVPAGARIRQIPQWLRRPPKRRTVENGAAALLVAASLVASGYIVWQHISLLHDQKRAAEFERAARNGVELMMTLDPEHARDNIQRTIDNSVGEMQSQLRVSSTILLEDAQKAKVSTKATAQDAAVESMTDNSAVVLVTAKSDTTNPDKSKRPPAFWRLSVGLKRADGQIKMSKFDFIQ